MVLLLAYYKAGLLCNTCVFLITVLYYMQYFIATAFGIAAYANYFSLFGPVFGIGQGAIDRPPGWTCIVDVVLKCYNRLAKGCIMEDPTKNIVLRDNSEMFVDDASHHHNDRNKAKVPQQLMMNVRHDTEMWG
eukprot:1349648-Ditylum_brightwellii.AAC.1